MAANGSKATFRHWSIYWEIESLMRLPETERFAISALRGFAASNSRLRPYYASNFKPEGPLLIEYPPSALWRERSR